MKERPRDARGVELTRRPFGTQMPTWEEAHARLVAFRDYPRGEDMPVDFRFEDLIAALTVLRLGAREDQ